VIPAVTYQDGVMAIGGALQLQAFGGAMVVRDLSLERPLGPLPRLSADVDVSGINLDTLTQAFAFGKIQGTLEGHVRALQLEGWKPVAFAAELHTVADDPLPHRISQRAVENLTSLGGGPGGALSRSLLRVFEDFSYDQLGLSCRLRAGVCEMGGLGPAKDGYYIVKGAGLPRIDVIGYSRRVDWNVLLQRLERVISTQGPVIE
jgi:hypothetical protein